MFPDDTGLMDRSGARRIAAIVMLTLAVSGAPAASAEDPVSIPAASKAVDNGDAKPTPQVDDSADQAAQIGLIGLYRPAEDAAASWILTSLVGQGSLSGNRADWFESGTELLYRAGPAVYLGGRIETREREGETDVLYSVLVSHTMSREFEWHATVTSASDPVFSTDSAYTAGFAWRARPQLSLLLDYSRLNFVTGSIDQYKSGATWWFNERTFLTGRYLYGRAFSEEDFEVYLLRLDLGVSDRFRAALSAVHGSDPEKELGIPRVIITQADTYTAYGHWALFPSLELILGAEYEDRKNVYTRSTGTVGLSLRF